jgi:Putative heavy-metal chelation
MTDAQAKTLELFRLQTLALARDHGLTAETVEVVSARPLTAEEAIGKPERSDFPILKGKEFMMEARFRGSRGQAFTAMPGEFQGTVEEILGREPETDFDRALVVATGNALLAQLGVTEKTAHCRDDGPRRCAEGIAQYMDEHFGTPKIALIGYQPSLITALVDTYPLRVPDMNPENVGQSRLGVLVEGVDETEEVIDWADVVLVTGTVLANDTIDGLLSTKPTVFYGVTIAGAAALLGYERYCPCAT